MTKKFWESQRSADVHAVKHVLSQAKKHRRNGEYHAELMQVVRLHMDGIRYINKRLNAYS